MKTKPVGLLAGSARERQEDARSRGTAATASRRWADAVPLGTVLDAAHRALPAGDRARDMIERFGADNDIALDRSLPSGTPRAEFDALSLIDAATAGLERMLRGAGFWEARVCAAWSGDRHLIAIHPHGEGAQPSLSCSSQREASDYIHDLIASEAGRIDAERARRHRRVAHAGQFAGVFGWVFEGLRKGKGA